MKAEAHISTERASHYIKTLCRHFSHKVQAEFNDTRGDVKFPFGDCEMTAEPGELVLRVQAEDEDSLDRLQEVVGGHLEEFAYRGETIAVQWQDSL